MAHDEAYERKSLMEAKAHARQIETAPLSERQEAKTEFLSAMKEPDLIAERISWLINGNYGYGEMMEAKQLVASPRMNRRAGLTHLIGLYEWQCPSRMAAEAWNKLSGAEKKMLDAALDIVIEAAEEDMKDDPSWSSRTGRK